MGFLPLLCRNFKTTIMNDNLRHQLLLGHPYGNEGANLFENIYLGLNPIIEEAIMTYNPNFDIESNNNKCKLLYTALLLCEKPSIIGTLLVDCHRVMQTKLSHTQCFYDKNKMQFEGTEKEHLRLLGKICISFIEWYPFLTIENKTWAFITLQDFEKYFIKKIKP